MHPRASDATESKSDKNTDTLMRPARWEETDQLASSSSQFSRLLNTHAPACDSVVVIEPMLTVGLGHRFGMLVFAVDMAVRVNARVALDDTFWDIRSKDLFEHTDYRWAWRLFPFPAESQVNGCRAGTGKVRQGPLSVDGFVTARATGGACGCVRVHTGATSCSNKWCFGAYEGSFDRVVPLFRSFMHSQSQTSAMTTAVALLQRNSTSQPNDPVTVLWHLRSGDNPVHTANSTVAALKASIDANLRRRGARHTIVTLDPDQLWKTYPWLRELGFEDQELPSKLPTLQAMINAEVLISTGSSYPLVAAALANVGRQIHLQFPPKEMGTHTFANLPERSRRSIRSAANELTPISLQQSGWYRTYFARTNTVPLFLDGTPLPPYGVKFIRMLRELDRDGAIAPQTAMLEYEYWLPPSSLMFGGNAAARGGLTLGDVVAPYRIASQVK